MLNKLQVFEPQIENDISLSSAIHTTIFWENNIHFNVFFMND